MRDVSLFTTATVQTASVDSAAFDLGPERALSVQATWDVNAPTSAVFVPGTLEIQTLTFPAASAAANGDFIVLEDVSGTKWALALTKSYAQIETWTFQTKAASVAGDHMLFYDAAGVQWGVSINKTGTDAQPTSAAWVALAAGKKAHVDISADTTAAQVAARVETAINALTGFTAAFTTDDSAADGTMLVTRDAVGPVTSSAWYKAAAGNSIGNGIGTSIVRTAIGTTGSTGSAPTGAIWSAVASANKDTLDVTALTDAISVAAAAELKLDALVGLTAVLTTDDTAADGTMTVTAVEPGPVTNPVSKNAAESGAGSVTGVQTTGGVAGVNLGSDSFKTTAHGLYTGIKGQMTTQTTLPTGLATSTDYYVIRVDADNFKLATTLAFALAGTAVNVTARGTGNQTFTPTALSATTKLQKSNDGTTWYDVHDDEVLGGANSQTISADGGVLWVIPDACWKYVKQVVAITAGQMTMATAAVAK